MHRRFIRGTDLSLTALAFGGASLGNLYRVTTDDEATAAVDEAWRVGIRYFDTAPHDGLGLSEERLGRLLRPYPRDDYVLSTKVGRLLVDRPSNGEFDSEGFVVPAAKQRIWDFTAAGIRESLHSSLQRLGTDRVDIALAHDPDKAAEGAGLEAAEALVDLRRNGDVCAVGVGTNDANEARKLIEQTDLDVVMLAGRYTLLEQDSGQQVLDAARASGKTIIAVGVFNSGLLATDQPAADAKYNYESAPSDLVRRAQMLAEICAAHGTSLPAAAIAFPLRYPEVVSVAVGMRTRAQVARNADLFATPVPETLWTALESMGLIPRAER